MSDLRPHVETTVLRLGDDIPDVRATLGQLEPLIVGSHAQIPHMATRAALEKLRGDVMTALAKQPSISAIWTMGIALLALVMAAGAICLLLVATLLRVPS
jgi:hypothetical protein